MMMKKKKNIKSFKCVCPACNNFVVSFFETKPNIWMVVDDHLLPSWVKNTKEQHNSVTCNKYNHILNQMVLINHQTFQEGVRGQTIKTENDVESYMKAIHITVGLSVSTIKKVLNKLRNDFLLKKKKIVL